LPAVNRRKALSAERSRLRASKIRIETRIGFALETEKNHIALESTRAVHVVFPHVFRRTLDLEKLARFAPREQLRGILRREKAMLCFTQDTELSQSRDAVI
jgi:hypothetical protein